jgi:hypothetical protein
MPPKKSVNVVEKKSTPKKSTSVKQVLKKQESESESELESGSASESESEKIKVKNTKEKTKKDTIKTKKDTNKTEVTKVTEMTNTIKQEEKTIDNNDNDNDNFTKLTENEEQIWVENISEQVPKEVLTEIPKEVIPLNKSETKYFEKPKFNKNRNDKRFSQSKKHTEYNKEKPSEYKEKYTEYNKEKPKEEIKDDENDNGKSYAKYNMTTGKRVGINKNSKALKFSYSDYENVVNPVFEVSTEDLIKVLIARSYQDGQITLKRSLEYVLRAMNHECNFPTSSEDTN